MLRVALVAPPFESVPPRLYGGTERVVNHLAQGLAASGIDVTLFASGDSRPAAGRLVPVTEKALRLRHVPVADANPYHLKILANVAALASEFDVIHSHHDYWLLPLSRMTRTPVLTTLHGRLDLPDIERVFSSYPDNYYVSISDSQRRPMPALPWVRTIHHGIDTAPLPFKPQAGKYLAFLGRIHPEKRPEWAIAIAQQAGVPLKIAAKIEGKEGQEYYDALVRPHVDGRMIEYVGEISEAEKADFLGDALGLVFPIDWPEPFGLVMIEALACGTPVLARPCGAAAEVLKDGVTGYSSMDIRELGHRVSDLASLDRKACREWVEDYFSLPRMIENYVHVYRQLANLASTRIRSPRFDRHRRDILYPVERVADGNS
jgi:glycosyltransferase involved in cell wall biosynthesis